MSVYAIIPAGGSGRRFGSKLPKQFMEVEGKPVIAYTLDSFQRSELVDEIIIAAGKDYCNRLYEIKEKFNLTKISAIVEGGKERQDSVFNCLKALKNPADSDLIVTHDAVRPLLTVALLNSAIVYAEKKGSAVVVKKVKNTLLKGNGKVESYLNREKIYSVETPQIFKYSVLASSFRKAREAKFYGTDESQLVFKASYEVNLLETDEINFKITTQSDLKLLKFFLNLSFK